MLIFIFRELPGPSFIQKSELRNMTPIFSISLEKNIFIRFAAVPMSRFGQLILKLGSLTLCHAWNSYTVPPASFLDCSAFSHAISKIKIIKIGHFFEKTDKTSYLFWFLLFSMRVINNLLTISEKINGKMLVKNEKNERRSNDLWIKMK